MTCYQCCGNIGNIIKRGFFAMRLLVHNTSSPPGLPPFLWTAPRQHGVFLFPSNWQTIQYPTLSHNSLLYSPFRSRSSGYPTPFSFFPLAALLSRSHTRCSKLMKVFTLLFPQPNSIHTLTHTHTRNLESSYCGTFWRTECPVVFFTLNPLAPTAARWSPHTHIANNIHAPSTRCLKTDKYKCLKNKHLTASRWANKNFQLPI